MISRLDLIPYTPSAEIHNLDIPLRDDRRSTTTNTTHRMPVESFIDLLTYTFQATVFVVLTTLLGYFIAGRTDRDLARVSLVNVTYSQAEI